MWCNVAWHKFTDLSQDRDAYTLRVKAGELRKGCTRLHGVKSHVLVTAVRTSDSGWRLGPSDNYMTPELRNALRNEFIFLKITTDGKHKGESKNVQQPILAYQVSAGGTRTTRTAGTTAEQPMRAVLQQTEAQTTLGQFARSQSMTQHTQQDSSGQVNRTSQRLLNWQHTTSIIDKHPYPRRDSNPQSPASERPKARVLYRAATGISSENYGGGKKESCSQVTWRSD